MNQYPPSGASPGAVKATGGAQITRRIFAGTLNGIAGALRGFETLTRARAIRTPKPDGSKSQGESPRRTINPEAAKLDDFAVFDVLRFVLAATVLLGHLDLLRWPHAPNLAVQVFFALSGWLIGGILCKTEFAELGRFYFNRATRIWIPYFVTVAALYATSLIHEAHRSTRWSEFLIYDMTFTHNWFSLLPNAEAAIAQMPLGRTGNHFWSLAAEEQFYLVAPLIMIFVPYGKRILPWACVAALFYVSGSQYAAISFGVLAAIIASSRRDWHLSPIARGVQALGFVVSIVLMGVGAYPLGAPLFSISTVLLCAIPVRRTAISRWLGGVSFPLYLNAWIGIFALHALLRHFGFLQNSWLTAMEFLCGVAGSAFMYHAIDAPVMARRQLWYTPRVGWCLGVVGYSLVLGGILFGLLMQWRG